VLKMKYEVFVLDSAKVPHAQEIQLEEEVLRDVATVQLIHLEHEDDFAVFHDRASAIILWHQLDLTAATIPKLTKTRIIVRNGVGYENVDIGSAASHGIPVSNVPNYGTEEVADHTLSLCLALSRELRTLMQDVGAGHWRWEVASSCRRIRGQVFGIVGCGRIGTAVALRAGAFGYQVCFYDPYVNSGYEKAIGVGREDHLAELLAKSDVVSLHVPLTDETHHLIDVPQLRAMKRGAFLLNTSRGPVISHAALEQALREGWIAGAALDVLEHEPAGVELFSQFPNCLMTPHSAFYSQESMVEMRRTSAQIVRQALLNNRLINVVNGIREPVVA